MENYKYMVCTRCPTYNHAPYIVDAMNGFCMQETSFPVVSVIIDDASTDGEQEIIETYLQENFDLNDSNIARQEENEDYYLIFAQHQTNKNCYFAVFFLKYNHYSIKKLKRPYYAEFENCVKYIALCEGDDYWTDSTKLQKQVDALDAHPELDMCACGAKVILKGVEIGEKSPSDLEKIISIKEVIEGGGGFFATNSLILRSSLIYEDKYTFWKIYQLDYFIQILGSLRGGIYYLPQFMAAYRFFTPASWTYTMKKNADAYYNHLDKKIQTLCFLDEETKYKYTESISIAKAKIYFLLFRAGLMGTHLDDTFLKFNSKNRIALIWRLFKKLLQTSKSKK